MEFVLALRIKNKILNNVNFKKNLKRTRTFEAEPADRFVCSIHPSNPYCCDMMLISLIILCVALFWILYRSVEFFDNI